ncbi:MAG: hypothetical protein JJ855_09030 [Rhodospirillales bacterium]|nr:hypothetical protein [Rhodospirillales bacterium]
MCGIFGVIASNRNGFGVSDFDRDIRHLFRLSRERGRDASGLAAYVPAKKEFDVVRYERDAKHFLDSAELANLINATFDVAGDGDTPLAAIGHCRLVTHGTLGIPENNQPTVAGPIVGVHNGILTNATALADKYLDNSKKEKSFSVTAESWATESDTRILYDVLARRAEREGSVAAGLASLYSEIEGHASIALLSSEDHAAFLATNTGSLYFVTDKTRGITVFASERWFLKTFLKDSRILGGAAPKTIEKLKPGQAARVLFSTGSTEVFDLKSGSTSLQSVDTPDAERISIRSLIPDPTKLKRCTKCILPETYPYIRFDADGVCNFCNHYTHETVHGRDALKRVLDKHRSKDGSPDCVFGLSGGRDSCYGLHLIINEYGMNPVAYTYDWGLTTDASRNNQAKICGKLGVEHIIRAPDIAQKRRFIQKNIQAWLKRPSLGMVPVFMAGDKSFLYYANQLKQEIGVDLGILCAGSRFEQRDFLMGFCGIDTMLSDNSRLSSYPLTVKAKLGTYYATEYLRNPSYFNESFFDHLWAFFASFIKPDRSLYLFEYLPWDEKEIEAVLQKEYGWETNKTYGANQWRMGDGQTAFTNYIWYTVAGFSEFDNFRAHQVREGLLTRDEALELVAIDNRPRYQTLEYFAHLVGLNLDDVLARINSIPKMYA